MALQGRGKLVQYENSRTMIYAPAEGAGWLTSDWRWEATFSGLGRPVFFNLDEQGPRHCRYRRQ